MGTGADDEDCEECTGGGGRMAGLLLLTIGAGAAYMGLDLLTGGAVTRLVAGAAFGRMPAVPAAAAPGDDSDTEGGPDSGNDDPA